MPAHLRSLQALELAVRTGSFTAAAELLGISPAAVGQRVKALEDALGLTLLIRGRAGILPAAALTPALPHLHAAFAGIKAASDALDGARSHALHVAALTDIAALWLLPRLPGFRAAHPTVRVSVNGEGDAGLRVARADCTLDYGATDDPGVEVLFGDWIVAIGSPANVARTGRIALADRLEGFPLLHHDFYRDDPAPLTWPRWLAANGLRRSVPERGVRFRRIVPMLAAVSADAGVALCGAALIAERLMSGEFRLACPRATARRARHGFVARFRTDGQASPALSWFRDWLRREAAMTEAHLNDAYAPGQAITARARP